MTEPIRPNRVDRAPAVPVWLVPQSNNFRNREHLEIIQEARISEHERRTAGPGVVIQQANSSVTILPEHLETIIDVLRAARDWRDES